MTSLRSILALWLVIAGGCGRLRFEDLGVDGVRDPDAGHGGAELDAGELGADAKALDDGAADAQDASSGRDGSVACRPGFAAPACSTCVRYVDRESKAAAPDGLTWDTAFPEIADAMDAAATAGARAPSPSGPRCQVWVRAGTYRIHERAASDTLALAASVALFGGFRGDEREPSERDLTVNTSILDGRDTSDSRRVRHVVRSSAGGSIDGFTIRGGGDVALDANTSDHGGGLLHEAGALVVRNVIFQENTSSGSGGAIYARSGTLIIEQSRFERNTANGLGGAIAVEALDGRSAEVLITRSELRANVAGGLGGGLYVAGNARVRLESVVAALNVAGGEAGAVYVSADSASVVGSTLFGNRGGSTTAALTLRCQGVCALLNSILWDPSNLPEHFVSGSVRYCIIRDGRNASTQVLDAEPRFVAPPTDLHLRSDSPAVDAANGCAGPERDFDGAPRRDEPATDNTGMGPVFSDIGAYEVQAGTAYQMFDSVCP